jgi:hypothetical protein
MQNYQKRCGFFAIGKLEFLESLTIRMNDIEFAFISRRDYIPFSLKDFRVQSIGGVAFNDVVMKTSAEKKIVLGFAASAAALLGLGWLSYWTTANTIAANNRVTHTYEVIATLEAGRVVLTDAETAQRGYLLTGDEQFLKDTQDAQAQVGGWIKQLRALTSDNPEQQQRLDKLGPLISQRLIIFLFDI